VPRTLFPCFCKDIQIHFNTENISSQAFNNPSKFEQNLKKAKMPKIKKGVPIFSGILSQKSCQVDDYNKQQYTILTNLLTDLHSAREEREFFQQKRRKT
jgi:hypothetical protein